MRDWTVEMQFKNMPPIEIPFESLNYISRASNAGSFNVTTLLNAETIDILRGSECILKFKGEPRFRGKVTNKVPRFDAGYIEFQGVDWNAMMFAREIEFQGYDISNYLYQRADYWDWDKSTHPPGDWIVMEGSDLIKLMLKHYCGEGVDSELYPTDELLYGFNVDNIESGYTNKQWRFAGETLGLSFTKIASMMQCATMRVGYHWWIDAYLRFWLRRYGDSVYNKELWASWSPPEEDSSSVINHIHLIGGIATPFPGDREALTNLVDDGGTPLLSASCAGPKHVPPNSNSKGWGCWITGAPGGGTTSGTLKVYSDDGLGFVSGNNETSIRAILDAPSGNQAYSFGFYYKINYAAAEFNDANYPDGELRNWSDRNQDENKVAQQIRTITFYFRQTLFGAESPLICTKLKIYTNSDAPNMDNGGANDIPPHDGFVHETDAGCYDLNIGPLLSKYQSETSQDIGYPWVRFSIVFDKGVNADTFANLKLGWPATGGGAGIGEPEGSIAGGVVDVAAVWDIFSDKTPPDPSDIWGIGFEFAAQTTTEHDKIKFAIDHLFVGFGEITIDRRDELSIAVLDREVEKSILDRHCHSWARGGHLATVLLDNLKYSTKNRTGVLDYFNPELRLNQLIPINEYGVEWMYVLEEIQVSVDVTGTKQTIKVGSPKPDPDELFDFYEVQLQNIRSAGAGKTIHDWVANTPCYQMCERYCEFACLSDWSSTWRRGGQVCQTSRELTCVSCESVAELNPCIVTCLKYSEIASIVQRPPLERSGVESTLLVAGPKVEAKVPSTEPTTKRKPTEGFIPPACRGIRRERY